MSMKSFLKSFIDRLRNEPNTYAMEHAIDLFSINRMISCMRNAYCQ